MSALLQGNGAPIPSTSGAGAPAIVHNGIPYEATGALAVENLGDIDHFHQGLPFTAAGRLATVINGVVDHYGSGAAPFAVGPRLVISTSAIDHYNSGVPYDSNGRVVTVAV